MSTNKLAQVIRKIVREEVRKEVRSLLNEQTKKPKVTKQEFNSGLKHALGLHDSVERRARKPVVEKQYTKNKLLNSILNETAGDIAAGHSSRLGSETGGYPTMNQTFTSDNAQTFDRNSLAAKLGYGDMAQGTPTVQEMVPDRNTSGGVNHNTEVDPAVAKALTRDYSELVKKFKK